MKRILAFLSIIFMVSGFLLVSCSKQDTAPKTEGTIEKGMYGEKAGEAMESVKETVSEKAGEAMESVKETVSEQTQDTIADYTEKAKEQVHGYTAPEKTAAGVEGEQAKDVIKNPTTR